MSKQANQLVIVGAAAIALVVLPVIGSAATRASPGLLLQGCMQAMMQRLTAESSAPVKLVGSEAPDVQSGGFNRDGRDQFLLTARDAHNARTIVQLVCTSDAEGRIQLESPSPPIP